MASIDALNALAHSVEAWSKFVSTATTPIDLTMANLSGRDLSHRPFARCNLDGADLESVNFDGCKFSACSLREASLERGSFVGCSLHNVDVTRSNLRNAVFRDTALTSVNLSSVDLQYSVVERCVWTECRLDQTKMTGASVDRCAFSGCEFIGLSADNITLTDCSFVQTAWTDFSLRHANIFHCQFENSRLSVVSISRGKLSSSTFLSCRITQIRLEDSHVSRMDFTRSTLRNVNLQELDLPGSVMLGTIVIDCEWPIQAGTISILGRYKPSIHLLRQPIQDLRGLSPILRREIADAQYLAEMDARSRGPLKRLLLRGWGVTCAFGTSLTRLTIVTASATLLIALGILSLDHKLFVWPLPMRLIWSEYVVVGTNVFGLSDTASTPPTAGREMLLPIAHLLGFFVLGLWVGLAANRLGRLSSE